MCKLARAIAAAFLVLIGLGGPAAAVMVDWDNAFALQTNGGISNPAVLVGFNPQPDPPAFATLLNVDNQMMPTWTIAGGFGPQPFRILFALNQTDLIRFDVTGTPDASGHFAFDAVDGSGTPLFNIMFDLTTSSGGVPDGSWVGFNPQPDPPADFLLGGGAAIGFDFQFTILSEAVLAVQIQEVEGNALGFTPSPVPLPAAVWMFFSALGGLGFVGWRQRRATA